MRIRWSPRARDQARAIFDFIAEDRPEAAERILEGLLERVRLLTELPEQGAVLPGLERGERRSVVHGSYRIIYRSDAEELIVLAVRHTRMEPR